MGDGGHGGQERRTKGEKGRRSGWEGGKRRKVETEMREDRKGERREVKTDTPPCQAAHDHHTKSADQPQKRCKCTIILEK